MKTKQTASQNIVPPDNRSPGRTVGCSSQARDSRRVSGMLVLSRKVKQIIWIGEDIQLTVVSVKGDNVRLGIVAPEAVRVDRDEVRRQMRKVAVLMDHHKA